MPAYRAYGHAGVRFLLFAFSVFLSISAAAHAELAGAAVIISGDTIEVQGRRVRLTGVTAPGGDQLCVSAQAQWRCGMVARLKLDQRIGSSSVICREQGVDRHGRILGRCRVDDGQRMELNRWLVTSGWALASGDHGQAYREAEERAAAPVYGGMDLNRPTNGVVSPSASPAMASSTVAAARSGTARSTRPASQRKPRALRSRLDGEHGCETVRDAKTCNQTRFAGAVLSFCRCRCERGPPRE